MNILYDKDNLFNISKFFNLNHSYNLILTSKFFFENRFIINRHNNFLKYYNTINLNTLYYDLNYNNINLYFEYEDDIPLNIVDTCYIKFDFNNFNYNFNIINYFTELKLFKFDNIAIHNNIYYILNYIEFVILQKFNYSKNNVLYKIMYYSLIDIFNNLKLNSISFSIYHIFSLLYHIYNNENDIIYNLFNFIPHYDLNNVSLNDFIDNYIIFYESFKKYLIIYKIDKFKFFEVSFIYLFVIYIYYNFIDFVKQDLQLNILLINKIIEITPDIYIIDNNIIPLYIKNYVIDHLTDIRISILP
tara:strand:- start:3229 stop:4134 length:906 start_codon:yes stop_codon:yes gene_type:complete